MFYDLNLPIDDESDASLQRERVCGLITLGYGACAAAVGVSGRLEEAHRCAHACGLHNTSGYQL